MLSNIEKCQLLAIMAHKGQKDKGGSPYIYHPAYVAQQVWNEDEQCVAWLHDVVEDSDFTIAEIKCFGLPDNIVEAVEAITKREDEDYKTYIQRVKANTLAKKVKLEDLKHNMDTLRFTSKPTEKDLKRQKKYKRAFLELSL